MRNRSLLRSMAVFLGAFILCGVLRVLTYHRDLCEGFPQLFSGAFLLVWAVSVCARVTDRRLRRLILCAAASLLGFLIVQTCRGNLTFGLPVLQRYFWYSYYIPYIGTPLMLFLCALAAYRPQAQPLPRWSRVVAAVTAALPLCALTNDLHQLMFRFPGGVFQDTDLYSPGPLFWLYFFCYGALLLSGFAVVLHKTWKIRRGLSFLLPAVPLLLLGVWMVQNLFHVVPAVGGVKLWIESHCFCFAFTAYLELCIQIGLIPANSGYGPLFSRLDLSAVILDQSNEPVYHSGGAAWPMPEGPTEQLRRQCINGGSVTWSTDLRPILALNRQLEDAGSELAQRNGFLREENRMKKERAELEFRAQLYEQVSEVLRPQLEEMEILSGAEAEEFAANLPKICVLTTYVKRRSNLELLRTDGRLPLEELDAALTETTDSLRLAGVEAAIGPSCTGELDADTVISAYESCFSLIADTLPDLRAFYVLITGGKDALEMRLMLRTGDLSRASIDCFPDVAVRPESHVSIEDGDVVVVLRFAERGRAS